jgi:hypothetical protein
MPWEFDTCKFVEVITLAQAFDNFGVLDLKFHLLFTIAFPGLIAFNPVIRGVKCHQV